MKRTGSYTQVISSAVLCAAALSAVLLIVWMGARAKSDIATTAAHVEEQVRLEETLTKAAQAAGKTETERKALSALVIGAGGGPAFIAVLDTAARTAGTSVIIQSIETEPAKEHIPGVLRFFIRFSGSYAETMRYVGLIETLPAASSISLLSIQFDEEQKEWSGTLSLSVASFDTP